MNGRLLGKEGREFAHKALELMDQFDVAPTPENYAVWICFASDTNPELCETLRTHIEAGEAFSETVNAELFEQYFQWKAIQDAILESGNLMSRELGAVKQSLEAAERDTVAYGKALEGATHELVASPDAAGTGCMVHSGSLGSHRVGGANPSSTRKLPSTWSPCSPYGSTVTL